MARGDYTTEHFSARLEDGDADPRTMPFMRAVIRGFHGTDVTGQEAKRATRNAVANDQELMLIRRRPGPDPALRDDPVATLSTFRGTVNMGAGILLPVAMVSEATVSPGDRRRGLLRTLMEKTLSHLAEQGAPLALLVASEGTIYGRYGYQPVYFAGTAQIGRPRAFNLLENPKVDAAESGTVEQVTLAWLFPHMQSIYERFHERYRLSISRQHGFSEYLYWRREKDAVDPRFRAAVHLDKRGRMDGYVTFMVVQDGQERVAKVREIVGANSACELALWSFIAGLDLVDRVDVLQQPESAFVRYATADPRAVEVRNIQDHLWSRILDPIAALRARAYSPAAREAQMGIRFKVEDELGFASGVYEVQLDETGVSVHRVESPLSALTLSVQALSSLVFGSACASELASAGMIRNATEDVTDYLDAMFAPVGPAHCAGDF